MIPDAFLASSTDNHLHNALLINFNIQNILVIFTQKNQNEVYYL
jgi:hypothetical protein